MSKLLQVNDLTLHYTTSRGVVRAIDGVSFTLEHGEAIGLVGESGAGKSSLALALMRLLPRNVAQFSGEVALDGQNCTELSDEAFRTEVRWRKMSMVFQGAQNSLNPVIRVGHQVAEPLLLQAGTSREEAFARTRQLFEQMYLPPEVFDRYPHELSGGMKQRALIAMALLLEPKAVILDEPTSALDVSVQAQVMNLLKRLKRELGLAILFITHDIALASDLCDTIGVMYAGQMVELGPADQVIPHPRHPYTEKLLAAIPRVDSEGRPDFIPGAPPDLVTPPSGCRFHPRCPYVFQRCPQELPPLLQVGADHHARCWLAEGESD